MILTLSELRVVAFTKFAKESEQVSAEWSRCPRPLDSVIESVWLLCDEAQQVGCLRG